MKFDSVTLKLQSNLYLKDMGATKENKAFDFRFVSYEKRKEIAKKPLLNSNI